MAETHNPAQMYTYLGRIFIYEVALAIGNQLDARGFRKSVEDTLATGRTLAFYRQAYIGYTKSSSVTDRHRTLRIDNSSTKGFGISLLKVIPWLVLGTCCS